ncbi:hypothetical protein CA235_07310 [Sphingomonas sp. ABOLF]|uniref:hypothetical protein n=1 Tax=Sphingomonas sp. ABOLF TaxID=1985879 RepID=UPI000F7DE236|nr:hypothetical protein [Sphingomonas sp. ABOLF]RSV15654.1 hypothetical protein CA235_07310 [Sphingomonas sp. ABOLF]
MGQQQEKTEQDGLDRSPAQFFFETGYFAAFAEACVEIGKAPFPLSDRIVERAWDVAGEAHDDRAEFDAYLVRANGSATNTPASNDFVLVPRIEAQALLVNLHARIDRAKAEAPDAVPMFPGIAALHDAVKASFAGNQPETGLRKAIEETIAHNRIRAEERRNVGETCREEMLVVGVLERIIGAVA